VTSTTTGARPTAVTWRGLLLVSLAGVVWGTIGPGVQLVHDGSGLAPLTISAYRAIAAVAVLLVISLVTGRLTKSWSLARQQWRRVTIVGLLTAAFQMLFFVAVVATGVSVATVVCLGFAPVLLLVVSSTEQRRLPSAGHALTVTIAVVGLLLVSLVGGAGDQAPNPVLGILAALGSGAAYGLSADVAAPLTQRLDTLTVTTTTMSVAAVVLVPGGLVLAYLRGESLTTTDTAAWLLIVYLGVVTMAVAYALLFTGLRSTPSGSAVVATLLEPVTAVLIAVLFLGERLTPAGLVGSLLILTAIASLGRQSEKPQPQ
jgi:DME family drug/metabolite transporter